MAAESRTNDGAALRSSGRAAGGPTVGNLPAAQPSTDEVMRTRAAVLWGVDQPWSVEDVEIGEPERGEVTVKLEAAGLCHSDHHLVTGSIPPAGFPVLGGHEGAGVITAAGPGVEGLAVGDHVVLSPVPSCGVVCELPGWTTQPVRLRDVAGVRGPGCEARGRPTDVGAGHVLTVCRGTPAVGRQDRSGGPLDPGLRCSVARCSPGTAPRPARPRSGPARTSRSSASAASACRRCRARPAQGRDTSSR